VTRIIYWRKRLMTDSSTNVIDERHSKFDFANGTVKLKVELIGTGEEDNAGQTADLVQMALLSELARYIPALTTASERATESAYEPATRPLVQRAEVPINGFTVRVRLAVNLTEGAALQEVTFIDLGGHLNAALANASTLVHRRSLAPKPSFLGGVLDGLLFGGGAGIDPFGHGHSHHHHV
jgi:hypothetical protein